MEPKVMTIVWQEGKEPIITAINLPGESSYRKNELCFIKEVLDFMEKKYKSLKEEHDNWSVPHNSHN